MQKRVLYLAHELEVVDHLERKGKINVRDYGDWTNKERKLIGRYLAAVPVKKPRQPGFLRHPGFGSGIPSKNPLWTTDVKTGQMPAAQVEEILNREGARYLVLGHIPTESNRIEVSGRVVYTDTRMGEGMRRDRGLVSATVIRNGLIDPIDNIPRTRSLYMREVSRDLRLCAGG